MICEFDTKDGPMYIRADIILAVAPMITKKSPKSPPREYGGHLKGVPSSDKDKTMVFCEEPLGNVLVEQHHFDVLTSWVQALMITHGIEEDIPEELEENTSCPE